MSKRLGLFSTVVLGSTLLACNSPIPDATMSVPQDLSVPKGEPNSVPDLAVLEMQDDMSAKVATTVDLLPAPYVPIDGGPGIDIIELVSAGTCEQQNGRLVGCHVGHIVLKAPPPSENGPFMTVLHTEVRGNCSTPYPFEYSVQADNDPLVLFNPFNSSRMLTTRRVDRGAIGTLTVDNTSVWESKAAYEISCRIWLQVELNKQDPN